MSVVCRRNSSFTDRTLLKISKMRQDSAGPWALRSSTGRRCVTTKRARSNGSMAAIAACSKMQVSRSSMVLRRLSRSAHDSDRQRADGHRAEYSARHGRVAARARFSGARACHYVERSVLSREISGACDRCRRWLHRCRICRNIPRARCQNDAASPGTAVPTRIRRYRSNVRRQSTARKTHRPDVRRDDASGRSRG